MKKIVVIILVALFLMVSLSVCFAAKISFFWVDVGPLSGGELAYSKVISDGDGDKISCDIVLGKDSSDAVDFFVAIETFDENSGSRSEVIEYHGSIKEGKLKNYPVFLTEIQETAYSTKEYYYVLIDYNDIFKKECLNNYKGLPKDALKKIKESFEKNK